MQKFFKEQNPDEIFQETRVKEYINKYIKELQRHFDLPDKKMRLILYKVYLELSPVNFVKNNIKKILDMLKSGWILIKRK